MAVTNKTATVNTSTSLTTTLTDISGNPISNASITFTVNSTPYTATTDASGVATTSYTPTTTGTQTVTVDYIGDTSYYNEENTYTITVITGTKTTPVVTLNDVTVTTTTAATINATITANGTGISGLTGILQVNGVNYSVTSGTGGVISKTVPQITIAGTYPITLIMNGNDTYNSTNTTASLIVTASGSGTTITADCTSLTDWTIYKRSSGSDPTVSSKGISLNSISYLFNNTIKTSGNCTITAVINANNLTTDSNVEIGFSTSNTTYSTRPFYLLLFTNTVKIDTENPDWSEVYTQSLTNTSNTDITIVFTIVNNICTAKINGTSINHTFTVASNDYIVINQGYTHDTQATLKNLSITYQ